MRIETKKLCEHPRNKEFFPRMEGEKWEEFKIDIAANGILNPIICTEGYTVVAGNERLRAAKEVGLEEVECTVKDYGGNADEVLYDLLRDNLMRRGGNGCSPMQLSNIAKEWSRLRAESRKKGSTSGVLHEVVPLQEALGMSKGQAYDCLRLQKLSPEWKNLVESGLNYRWAATMISTMPKDEQDKLFAMLPEKEAVSPSMVKKLMADLEEKEKLIAEQDRCIKKYEEDEDATSDAMENLYIELQDTKDLLAAATADGAEAQNALIRQAQEDRDSAFAVAAEAEAKEKKAKKALEWLETSRNDAREKLAQYDSAALQVAIKENSACLMNILSALKSEFKMASKYQHIDMVKSIDEVVAALDNLCGKLDSETKTE